MSARSRGTRRDEGLRRAGLAATALLCAVGLLALLAGGERGQGAFVAVSALLPGALILVGAPRRGRPFGGALLVATSLGTLLLVTGLFITTEARSLALLFAGLGLGPLLLTLLVFTLRFEREQQPDDEELESLRRLGDSS